MYNRQKPSLSQNIFNRESVEISSRSKHLHKDGDAIIGDNNPMNNNLSDRIIGILGGMGPEATLDLYRQIIRLTPAVKDQDHIQVLIYSDPKIPDRTKAIAENGESPLPYLVHSAMLLEQSGASVIVMPCNTSHHFLPEIQKNVKIPILNMIEETCRTLLSRLPKTKTVGLLATIGTLRSGIYEKVLGKSGVKVLVPDHMEQEKIQAAVARVKAGIHDRSTRDIFESAGSKMIHSGAEAVILGCTEIPLVFDPESVDYACLNSTLILAQAAVDWALRKK
jgi:aspartate racemase